MALNNFFNQSGTVWHLVYHPCEWEEHRNSPWCKRWLAPPKVSASLRSWMRNPECVTSFREWHSSNLDSPTWTFSEWRDNSETIRSMDWNELATTATTLGCCDSCVILGGNVDVHYWPVPGANTDCLSTIGTSYRHPDDGFFATDDRGHKHFKSRPNPYAQNATSSKPTATRATTPTKRLRFRSVGPLLNHSIALNHSISVNQTMPVSTAVVSGYTMSVSRDCKP